MPGKSNMSRTPRTAAPAGRNGTVNGHTHHGKPDHKILFQKYFKSISPREYKAYIKQHPSGSQYLVLTESKRDPETGEIKKTKLSIYSEDFGQYFRMLHETAQFIKSHPVPEEVKERRQRYWAKKEAEQAAAAREAAAAAKPIHPTKIMPPKAPTRKPARGR